MDFGEALTTLKGGDKVRRAGWNGKGMWLMLVNPEEVIVSVGGFPKVGEFGKLLLNHAVQESFDLAPWIGMKTADNKFVPWLASQTDILAEDWEIAD